MKPVATNPYAVNASDVKLDSAEGDIHLIKPLYSVKGWLHVLGMINIIFGVLLCLTLVGALIGWLPLWFGLRATRAAELFDQGYARCDPFAAAEGIQKLAICIRVMGIAAAITIVVLITSVILQLLVFASMAVSIDSW